MRGHVFRVHVSRVAVPCTALGLTIAAAISAAHAQTIYDSAQTVIAPPPVVVAPPAAAVIAPPPLRTVRTVTTTTTTHPVRHVAVRHRAIARHPYVTGRAVPATTTTTTTVATTLVPAPYVTPPLYDAAPPPTVEPYDTVPLYDAEDADVAPAPGPAIIPATAAAVVVPVAPGAPAYRYVYQDDRILVIDPNTGIAVEAIPR